MPNQVYIVLLALFCFSCIGGGDNLSDAGSVPETIDFNLHVRPILSDRCFACHGPDENARKADLRLDLEQFAFALLDSVEGTYALVPGKPGESEMIRRISSHDPEYMMPPPESNLSLSETDIRILTRWVEQGAEWKEHWSFIPPEPVDLPVVLDPEWIKNPVDHFVLSRLEKEGLHPSEEASKEKLIRRLSFDLRGLPPTLEEIDRYLDDEDPQAYERLVETFMASKAYGERMAMEWLDLARYADSHGYQDDLERSQWPWRDWVIEAFNQNIPYDQFVTWQLAGDLMPDATYDQKLATGFNRNHKITQEVGVINEEYRVEYVLDRVNTFSTSFLGLTVACAQCHDHKFDPISQKEFYSLFSFFNNVPEEGRVEYGVEVAEPSIPLPEETAQKYIEYIEDLVRSQEESLYQYELNQWEAFSAHPTHSNKEYSGAPDPAGLDAYYSLDYQVDDQVIGEFGAVAPILGAPAPVPGRFSGGLEFNGQNSVDLGHLPSLDFRKPVTLSIWLYSIDGGGRGAILSTNRKENELKSGFALLMFNEYLEFELTQYLPTKQNKGEMALHRLVLLKTRDIIPGNQWVQITLAYDGSGRADGFRLYRDGEPVELVAIIDDIKNLSPPGPVQIGKNDNFAKIRWLNRTRLDEVMIFSRQLSQREVSALAHYDPIASLVTRSRLSGHQTKRLFYHQLHHTDPDHQFLTQRLSEYKVRETRMKNVVLNPTMIMAERDTVRPTYILDRGQYSAPTEEVFPGTPESVLPYSDRNPPNRLGLAQWLFDRRNPLTARVAVNRYWQMIFGRGIVATTEDFGSQGDLPSHPLLLDWLAVDFQSSGWDLKRLIKTLVTSATYRQTASLTPDLAGSDPDNILLARGPQVRLTAEMVRDHALATSGLLSPEIGGPSVKPYQPDGLWLQIASGNQPLKKYIQDHGKDLYRRSLYTFWKRSLPPPSMIAFDGPTREQCQVRRQSTSTPMQALVLLNDPQFVESSRLIAQRMLLEGGTTEESRIRFAFRLATSRAPSSTEMDLLRELLDNQRQTFSEDPERALKLVKVGEYPWSHQLDAVELASYTIVANAIMNLTESIRKG